MIKILRHFTITGAVGGKIKVIDCLESLISVSVISNNTFTIKTITVL